MDRDPYSESVQHVDFGGYYLTHAIWHNDHGSYQPETGVRSRAQGLKDFRLIQHGLGQLANGHGSDTGGPIEGLGRVPDRRRDRLAARAQSEAYHPRTVCRHALQLCAHANAYWRSITRREKWTRL